MLKILPMGLLKKYFNMPALGVLLALSGVVRFATPYFVPESSPQDMQDLLEAIKQVPDNFFEASRLILQNRNGLAIASFIISIASLPATVPRISRIINRDVRKLTWSAYHESGHTLVGNKLFPEDAFKFASIVRGLDHSGVALFDLQNLGTRDNLVSLLALLLAGNAAEEEVFGRFRAGTYDDLKRVEKIATKMVVEYGMGGLVEECEGDIDDMEQQKKIDRAISKIIMEAEEIARQTIRENRAALDAIAQALLEAHKPWSLKSGRVYRKQIEQIIKDNPPQKIEEKPGNISSTGFEGFCYIYG